MLVLALDEGRALGRPLVEPVEDIIHNGLGVGILLGEDETGQIEGSDEYKETVLALGVELEVLVLLGRLRDLDELLAALVGDLRVVLAVEDTDRELNGGEEGLDDLKERRIERNERGRGEGENRRGREKTREEGPRSSP